MVPTEIVGLRNALGLTQAQFASLLGVHSLTVSKWERGLLAPSPYQLALMQSFDRSQKQSPGVGELVAGVLLGAGVGAALYLLLKPAFEASAGASRSRRRT